MNSITIDNLEDALTHRLCVRAAESGRSVEEEAREILKTALRKETIPAKGLGAAIHELFHPIGGVCLELPKRDAMREPPSFE